jgi:hypothetical protein
MFKPETDYSVHVESGDLDNPRLFRSGING